MECDKRGTKDIRQQNIAMLKAENGSILINKTGMAANLNNFFSLMGPKLNAISMFLEPVNDSDILAVIHSLNSFRSCGEDGIPSYVIKDNHISLLMPLKHLINTIFNICIYPDVFKNCSTA